MAIDPQPIQSHSPKRRGRFGNKLFRKGLWGKLPLAA